MKIPFNKPAVTGLEVDLVQDAISRGSLSGDAFYGNKCKEWFEQELKCDTALLTPSCTAALEMSAILIDCSQGDEIIMPSYTFVSTANAFVLRGCKIVFVDIDPQTMNIDAKKIRAAVNKKTKAIVVVHYAGVSCDMQEIMQISKEHDLYVIEDAAQAVDSYYQNKPLGTIGHLGAYSFHETKNITSGGEGGLLIVNDKTLSLRAEIIREKGTNRTAFFRGVVDKYNWVDIGSSYLPSELQAAYLWAQLIQLNNITHKRKLIWNCYNTLFEKIRLTNEVDVPCIPEDCHFNAHMFYIKLENKMRRNAFIQYMSNQGILAVFHYIPLHSSPAGSEYSTFLGEDCSTTIESERLVRLPIYYNMTDAELSFILEKVETYFKQKH